MTAPVGGGGDMWPPPQLAPRRLALGAPSLSIIVASIALVPSALCIALKPFVPGWLTLGLAHVAGTGFAAALAATDAFADASTGLLGKARAAFAPLASAACARVCRRP
jgi:hypothetical protein